MQQLRLTGALERTLHTTNIIENLMGSVEGCTRRVKRWRGGLDDSVSGERVGGAWSRASGGVRATATCAA